MAFEKEIAHSLYSAYEAYLDLKAQLHDVQQLRVEQLQAMKEGQNELALTEDGSEQDGKNGSSSAEDENSSSHKKPPPTLEERELQIHRDLDQLAKKIEVAVQLLTQSHTSSAAMLGEFENLRTFKIMTGESYALNGVLPLKAKK
jgi:hypothetical protein